jgi:hypothetical protein
MGHDSLGNIFKTNFALMQHHHWHLSHLETLMPWERYVYIDLLDAYLKEQEKLNKLREQEQRAEYEQMIRRAKANKR